MNQTARGSFPTPAAAGFRMPAEWEHHAATWLTWPSSGDWPGKLEAVRWVYCDIIRQLTRVERVKLLVQDDATRSQANEALLRAAVDVARVDFFVAETNRTWARDNLPSFVVDASRTRLGAVKWRFNGWARYPDHELDERAGQLVAQAAGSPVWLPSASDGHFVLEGGSIEVDGAGSVLTTRRCLLGSPFTRNPGLSQTDVEQVLKDYLGVSHVMWLEDGIAGDDTSGHIDDFARFVAPGRVVIARESNANDDNYVLLERAREELLGLRDAQDRRLDVVDLPMPEAIHFDGERLPASYANFYIANDLVLVPTFNDPQDRIALGILAELFPDRVVRGIHAVDLVVGLGTLHCSTQQEPAVLREK